MEKGYRAVTVADIVRRAGIARNTFYENFSSKEDCFFALYDNTAKETLNVVAEACEGVDGEFADRLRVGLEALLGYLAEDPVRARAFVVEGPAVGPAINERFERVVADFAALLRRGRPDEAATELPETVEETVVGGLYWLLYYALLDGRPKRIQKLLPQLTEFALIPFAGGDAAAAPASS